MISSFAFAFLATMAFAVLFQAPRKILLTNGLIGAVGWVIFISLRDQMGYSSFYANFFDAGAGTVKRTFGQGFLSSRQRFSLFPVSDRWFPDWVFIKGCLL